MLAAAGPRTTTMVDAFLEWNPLLQALVPRPQVLLRQRILNEQLWLGLLQGNQ